MPRGDAEPPSITGRPERVAAASQPGSDADTASDDSGHSCSVTRRTPAPFEVGVVATSISCVIDAVTPLTLANPTISMGVVRPTGGLKNVAVPSSPPASSHVAPVGSVTVIACESRISLLSWISTAMRMTRAPLDLVYGTRRV